MKNQFEYIEEIKLKYPESMNKEQFYKAAHISKYTALYLLQSGLVPCSDSGKKTRRYVIKTEDVVQYLLDRIVYPAKYSIPKGWRSDQAPTSQNTKNIKPICLTYEQREKLQQYWQDEMQFLDDLLCIDDLADFLCCSYDQIINWCTKGKLKYFCISRKYLIPKICAAEFLSSDEMINSKYLSYKY